METPSSTRRVTRSQTRSAINSSATNLMKTEDKDIVQRNCVKPHQDRSALFDITNDSPIVGVATSQTPSSGVVGKGRNMSRIKNTPGSGEALLRGQVKTLLQRVEEEADLTKISIESRPFIHLVNSPMGLLAPTPANTPQVVDFSCNEENRAKIVITSPVVSGLLRAASQAEEGYVFEKKEESLELVKSPSITRSLMLDFSSDCSSVVTRNTEDDNSSVWSLQVNASTKDEDGYYTEDECYEGEEGVVDGLCEEMWKLSVEAEFKGKHTRFVYDSEDEEIVDVDDEDEKTPGELRLKAFPTPIAKHVRFTSGDE